MRQTVAGTGKGDGKQQLIGKCLDVFLTFRPPNRVIRHLTIEWIGITEKTAPLAIDVASEPATRCDHQDQPRGTNDSGSTRSVAVSSTRRTVTVSPLVVASASIRGSCPHGIINSARLAPACAIAVRMSVSIRLSSTISP
jgi:hypothetical protein